MPYRSKEEQREYQRKWIAARRAKWFTENGPCVVCGSDKDLELHHKDPSKKVSHRIWSWSWKRIREETKKCEVRCHKCHQTHEVERYRRNRVPVHGTHTEYHYYKCRCVECRKAHAKFWREYRRRKKQLTGC